MELIATRDGSSTAKSREYGETYHSMSGAIEEAQRKFVEPCRIRDGMRILDIGFGLGYTAGMAFHAAKNLEIVSLEKDIVDIGRIRVPAWFIPYYAKIQSAAKELRFSDADHQVTIITGDAVETIRNCAGLFDAVFLDPFSPPKNPELWTVDFLSKVHGLTKPGSRLATYSCAGQVRRNLKEVGFHVEDGPVVGRRAPGTVGIKV